MHELNFRNYWRRQWLAKKWFRNFTHEMVAICIFPNKKNWNWVLLFFASIDQTSIIQLSSLSSSNYYNSDKIARFSKASSSALLKENFFFQIIPRVMPALVPEQNLREKFSNDDYVNEVENMFREKFLQNLDVSPFQISNQKSRNITWNMTVKFSEQISFVY